MSPGELQTTLVSRQKNRENSSLRRLTGIAAVDKEASGCRSDRRAESQEQAEGGS
jgi:hypothetical protein